MTDAPTGPDGPQGRPRDRRALTAREYADVLWLWEQIARYAPAPGPESGDQADHAEPPPAEPAASEEQAPTPATRDAPSTRDGADQPDATDVDHPGSTGPSFDPSVLLSGPTWNPKPEGSLLDGDEHLRDSGPLARLEDIVARVPAITDWSRSAPGGVRLRRSGIFIAPSTRATQRGIVGALRPLRQNAYSMHESIVDDDATAERVLLDPASVPVIRPAAERRWDLYVLIDDSRSMRTLWIQPFRTLTDVLERAGVFRDIHVRFFDGSRRRPEDLRLRTSPNNRYLARPFTEPLETGRRRIVWILTDGIGAAWSSGTMSEAVWSWSHQHPVAIVTPLPAHMWHRTGLLPRHVRIHRRPDDAGGAPDLAGWDLIGFEGETCADQEHPLAMPVPILTPDPLSLTRWARFLVGVDRSALEVPAFLAAHRSRSEEHSPDRHAADPIGSRLPLSAEEKVQRFQAAARPSAFDLATHLAAAPLTWSVLRRVPTLVPFARSADLAELFLCDLVRPTNPRAGPATGGTDSGEKNSEGLALEFQPGVREALLSHGRRTDTMRVMRLVGNLLGPRIEAMRNVDAVLDDPDGAPIPAVTADSRPFVAVQQAVMAALSDRFYPRSKLLAEALVEASVSGDNLQSAPTEIRNVMVNSDLDPPKPPAMRAASEVGAHGWRADPDPAGGDVSLQSTAVGNAPAVETRRPRRASIWGNVPQRNPFFTGRTELLAKLRERLPEGTTAVLPESLHGMGGVGKSQLAVEYVYRHQNDYDVIWWISAERPAQIRQALVGLARNLGLTAGEEANTAVPAVLEALRTGKPYSNWLLIFDNADDPREVRDFFPRGGEGRILVTSRNPQWAGVGPRIEVDVFTRAESIELLRRRVPRVSDADADRLADALGDLPLAIEQAATWLAETNMAASGYLDLFEQQRAALLDTPPPVDYQLPVRAAWNVSLDRLETSNIPALRLLQVCAFLAPEPISRLMFVRGGTVAVDPALDPTLQDSFKLGQAIREVTRYALARLDPPTDSLQMHRLVQAVLIDRMTPDTRERLRHGARMLLAANDPFNPGTADTWDTYSTLYPHLNTSEAYLDQNPRVRDLILNEVEYLYKWGDHRGALELAVVTHQAWSQHFGEIDPRTLQIMGYHGWMLYVVGRYSEAVDVNKRLLELCTDVHGPNHPETLSALGNVRADQCASDDFLGALETAEEAYRRARVSYGDNDETTLTAAHNVGVCRRLVGDFAGARDIHRDVWERRAGLYGDSYLATMISYNAYNIDVRELGDYFEARSNLQELVTRYPSVVRFAENHHELLRASRHLSIAYRKAGHHAAALKLSRDVDRRLRLRYGADHPETLAAALGLSIDLRHVGELEQAREICDDTLTRYRASFGADHSHTRSAEVNLAIVYRLAGDAEKAYDIDKGAVAVLERKLGADHPSTLVAAANLATDLYSLGRIEEARRRDEETVSSARRIWPENHPFTLVCSANLAIDLRALGEKADAEQLHAETLGYLDNVLGVEHPATRAVASWVRSDSDIDPMPL